MNSKRKTSIYLVSLVAFMAAASFLAVPFYSWFCKVTGYGGTPQVAMLSSEQTLDEQITVRFDGSLDNKLSWKFKPLQHQIKINIGETGLAFFEAYNPTNRPIAGQASYNVVPYSAGSYFNKIECFCFQEQVLMPGEKVEMPVSFFIDPEIRDDLEAKFVKSITLSYTFYEIELPENETTETNVTRDL
tara:strand:- start:178 stop:741 length:564 start_codon:yes stop_codon:yes gene_type:complete